MSQNESVVAKTVSRCRRFFKIDCQLQTKSFDHYSEISKTSRGVYILESEHHEIIYVGKGNVRARQDSHWPKAIGESKTYTPKGWQWLQENVKTTPKNWQLHYIELAKETELSAMEGSLIHLLQPLANDETFRDRISIAGA
jgi:excinuclease UvrABC nuclease subunit